MIGNFVLKFYRLEPLLLRIKEKRSAVLCPGIDMISEQNMGYGVSGRCILFGLLFRIFEGHG